MGKVKISAAFETGFAHLFHLWGSFVPSNKSVSKYLEKYDFFVTFIVYEILKLFKTK